MNYTQPLQKQSSGLWHYTTFNDRDKYAYPIGYCAKGCPGHATAEEAIQHYKDYQINERLRFTECCSNTQHKCDECGVFTQGMAQIDGWSSLSLCEAHQTKEIVAKHYSVGESISS